MAQPIQSYLAGDQMLESMIARNQGPMTRELVRGGPQAMHDPSSSVAVNRQPQAEMQYANQQIGQNIYTKGVGEQNRLTAEARKEAASSSDSQEFMNRRLGEALYANLEQMGGSSRLMELQQVLNDPNQRGDFLDTIAKGKAQAVNSTNLV